MNNTSRIFMALAIGAAAGTVIALLYAPASGAATRKTIKDQSKKLVDTVQKKYRNTNEKVNNLKEDLQHSYDLVKEKVLS